MVRVCLIVVMLLGAVQAADSEYQREIEPLLDIYCYGCHGDGSAKGGFSMDEFDDLGAHLDDLDHWLPIWRNVRSQIMPPSDEDQLTIEEKRQLTTWIERAVFKLDPESPDPGRVTLRRLNRDEYQYAIRDLLSFDFNAAEYLPADDTGYGFDNIGDVLSISPLLMEKYVAAAEYVVNKALPPGQLVKDPEQILKATDFVEPDDPKETGRYMLLSEDETIIANRQIPWDGYYQVILEYSVKGASEATEQQANLKVTCNDMLLGKAGIGWDQRKVIHMQGRMPFNKGPMDFKIEVIQTRPPGEGQEELALVVGKAIIRGPLDGSQRRYSGRHAMIFDEGAPPKDEAARTAYGRRIISRFAERAFRRPPSESTVDRLMTIAEEVSGGVGKSFEDGIRSALTACLCSPRFLFRIEEQPEPDNPEKVVMLDDYSLASCLSFFLWRSVPDRQLLDLASRGELRSQLSEQIDRMLADPKSQRLVNDFVGQWLQTRDVMTITTQPHVIMGLNRRRDGVRVFNNRLRENMAAETLMLFNHVLQEDRPLEELISADYSFLNERLAAFYGIDGVKGEQLVEVDLKDHPERGGLLTQGSFLLITSNPTRTSPVKRGLFVLDNILGTPAPPAPPDVPELEEIAEEKGKEVTMREMMEIHRKNPDCRGCHARMDPIGLGLENFDGLGRYRESEHGQPIDAGGQLVTGETFASVAELKQILATSRRDDFYRCFSEKLLTFALGRGVEYYDATTVDQLVSRLKANDGKIRELILGIVESAPFQMRRGTD